MRDQVSSSVNDDPETSYDDDAEGEPNGTSAVTDAEKPTIDEHNGATNEASSLAQTPSFQTPSVVMETPEAGMTSTTAAWIFLGTVQIVLTIFYLVNGPSTRAQGITWKTLSGVVSVIVAGLFFITFKALMDEIVLQKKYSEAGYIGACISRMLVFWIIVEGAFVVCRHKTFAIACWSSVGAHVVGFAACEAFARVQEIEPWKEGSGFSFLVALIAWFSLVPISHIARLLRHNLVKVEGEPLTAQETNWMQSCDHAEDIIAAMTIGLLLTQTSRYVMTKDLPYFHWTQQNEHVGNIRGLLVMVPIFKILGTALGLAANKGFSPVLVRLFKATSEVMTFAMAWSLFYWGKWEFAATDLMKTAMIQAVVYTYVAFLYIFCIATVFSNCMPKLSITFASFTESLELIIGLSWLSCFFTVIRAADTNYQTGLPFRGKEAAACLYLVVMLAPAWVLYILPKSLAATKDAELASGERLPLEAERQGDGTGAPPQNEYNAN